MKYLKELIVGSSVFIYLHFLLSVQSVKKYTNYSYEQYSLVVPLYFGILNVISAIYSQHFKLSTIQRFGSILIISYLITIISVTCNKSYNFTKNQWIRYYITLFIMYCLSWSIIYLIESSI